MSTPTSVEQLVNMALDTIGFSEYVEDINEGTKQARVALDLYAQTRDGLLREFIWGFAEKIAAATTTGHAAPFPWTTEYTYPANCLLLRNLFDPGYVANTNNPLPNLWTIGSSVAGPKVIWCQTAGATLVYTAQVVDMTQWEPLFVETFVMRLGKRIALGLEKPEFLQVAGAEEKRLMPMSEEILG
jgi:hypothetical protein